MKTFPSLYFAALLIAMTSASLLAAEPSWTTAKGYFKVSYTSEPTPVPLNQIHQWIFHLETPNGAPVEGAAISVAGGMPAHNHGMPTSPRQTSSLGGGDYLVEGMRFHMMGEWEIRLEIRAADLQDSVTIPLHL